METRNKKKISPKLSGKKIRKNKRGFSTSFKRRGRSQDDVKKLNERSTKEMSGGELKEDQVEEPVDAFKFSSRRCFEVLNHIFFRETPTFETRMQWEESAKSFYFQMCTFSGVDPDNLEKTVEDEDDEDEEQEVHRETRGVYLDYRPSTKEIPHEEYEKLIKNTKRGCEKNILTGPFKFGAYFCGKPDRIPYHLYLLVKKAIDIMNSDDQTDLTIAEEKIRFFCNYFYAHLPTGWNYNRENAHTLIDGYDATANPTDLMAGYTPIPIYETIDYDEESGLSPLAMVLVMGIIYSRKMPIFCRMSPEMIAFYCKLCSCFGIDYQRVDAASTDDVCMMETTEKPPSFVFEPYTCSATMDTRNKKISPKLSGKKIRKNKRASSTSLKLRGRSQDVSHFVLKDMKKLESNEPSRKEMSGEELNEVQVEEARHFELKDMKKLESNDEAFHLSWMKISDIMDIIRSRKTPTPDTYMQWDEYARSFYVKMCNCIGVDYKNLENNLKDDDKNGEKHMSLKEQEEQMESTGVNLPSTKNMSNEEYAQQTKNTKIDFVRQTLRVPFLFGAFFSGEPDHIPYHLYLLVKKAVDIMNSDDQTDLAIVEEKIKFFCNYFYVHLPTGWNYNRENAHTLINGYDTTVKTRDLMAGYTPIPIYETIHYDPESMLAPVDMDYAFGMIYSRKKPSIWGCGPMIMAFYCRLCSCFGIDYRNVDVAASEDDVCLMKTAEEPPSYIFTSP